MFRQAAAQTEMIFKEASRFYEIHGAFVGWRLKISSKIFETPTLT